MRIGRQTAERSHFAAKIFQLFQSQTPLEEGTRIDPGSRVSLKKDLISPIRIVLAAEEMIETDFIQSRRRGIGRM